MLLFSLLDALLLASYVTIRIIKDMTKNTIVISKCTLNTGTIAGGIGGGGSGGGGIRGRRILTSRLARRRRHGCSCFFLRTVQVGRGGRCSTTFKLLRRYLSVRPGTSSTLCRVSRCCVFLHRIPRKRTTLRGTIACTPSGC